MQTGTSSSISDRRKYFRINDQIALKYRIIEETEMDDTRKERRADLSRINSVAPSFTNINLDMKQEMDKCRRDLPEVAAYLEGLNSKVDLLIRLLVANASGLPDYPTHEVNLSASGLSFPVQREIAVGTMLEMQLLFSVLSIR